ncbi:MAG: tRNA lysidine(34) synthetase TilS, partial [Lachnospiraceae bacterium]
MLQKIKAYIQQNNMLEDCPRVIVALSGGADSVCLLLVMNELKEEFGYELAAIHVNHCIRGQEADADEAFCVELCRKNNIDLTVIKKDVTALAKEWHMSVEEAGRKVRYDAFNAALEEGMGRIAVAHHMNDNAETILFNMARGSAMAGVVGIRP